MNVLQGLLSSFSLKSKAAGGNQSMCNLSEWLFSTKRLQNLKPFLNKEKQNLKPCNMSINAAHVSVHYISHAGTQMAGFPVYSKLQFSSDNWLLAIGWRIPAKGLGWLQTNGWHLYGSLALNLPSLEWPYLIWHPRHSIMIQAAT